MSDRLARLVARALHVPIAVVTLVDTDGRTWKNSLGLTDLGTGAPAASLVQDLCRRVVHTMEPLIVADTREYPWVRDIASQGGMDVLAYASVPVRIGDGAVVGSLCVFDQHPRPWTADDLDVLHDTARLIVTEVELRVALRASAAQAQEQASLYAEARERARAAERVAQARAQLVADVCHELRTPLNAIIGFVDLLRKYGEQWSDEGRRERLQQVLIAADHQRRLIEDLLTASRLEGGVLALRSEPVQVSALARQAAAMVRGSYRGQRIVLRGPRALRALADAERVRAVLLNLLDNAAKYSRQGSPITVVWRVEDDAAVIRVQDQGWGIPDTSQKCLFTPFGRVPGTQQRPGRSSTGLGLYLSRRFAEAMGGDLNLESTGTSGSIFRLRLPLARDQSTSTMRGVYDSRRSPGECRSC